MDNELFSNFKNITLKNFYRLHNMSMPPKNESKNTEQDNTHTATHLFCLPQQRLTDDTHRLTDDAQQCMERFTQQQQIALQQQQYRQNQYQKQMLKYEKQKQQQQQQNQAISEIEKQRRYIIMAEKIKDKISYSQYSKMILESANKIKALDKTIYRRAINNIVAVNHHMRYICFTKDIHVVHNDYILLKGSLISQEHIIKIEGEICIIAMTRIIYGTDQFLGIALGVFDTETQKPIIFDITYMDKDVDVQKKNLKMVVDKFHANPTFIDELYMKILCNNIPTNKNISTNSTIA